MKDKRKFCPRCQSVRSAEHFKQVVRSDGSLITVCGSCAASLKKAKTPQGRALLEKRDRADRAAAARAWSAEMLKRRAAR